MPQQTRIVSPGPRHRTVRLADGTTLEVPEGWDLREPGDAALTRRVKQAGPSWTMQSRKGRRLFSLGVWAPAERIASLRDQLETERQSPTYTKRLEAGRTRRAEKQAAYEQEFVGAVFDYLRFDPAYTDLARRLSVVIAEHATPVGSGTVARTQRLPVEKRAELAVLAWMRHQTTDYDSMKIARRKGQRREVRHRLAQQSLRLLAVLRSSSSGPRPPGPNDSPITKAEAAQRFERALVQSQNSPHDFSDEDDSADDEID